MDGDGEREVELAGSLALHPDHGQSLAVDGVQPDPVVARVRHGHRGPVLAQSHVLRLTQLTLSVVATLVVCVKGGNWIGVGRLFSNIYQVLDSLLNKLLYLLNLKVIFGSMKVAVG